MGCPSILHADAARCLVQAQKGKELTDICVQYEGQVQNLAGAACFKLAMTHLSAIWWPPTCRPGLSMARPPNQPVLPQPQGCISTTPAASSTCRNRWISRVGVARSWGPALPQRFADVSHLPGRVSLLLCQVRGQLSKLPQNLRTNLCLKVAQ